MKYANPTIYLVDGSEESYPSAVLFFDAEGRLARVEAHPGAMVRKIVGEA